SDKILDTYCITYIDKDSVDDVFSLTRTDDHYKNHKKYVWDIIYNAILIPNISRGNSILLDSPLSSAYLGNLERIEYIKDMSKKYNFKIKMIWCKASLETREKRLKMRDHPRDQERYHELKEFVAREKTFDIPFDHIIFDTEGDNIGKVYDFLKGEKIL
ncbi:MAG TPA: AAA family ATPase, partial [Candidatus Absconditabacterales bacterium]|nr:AAA family ATPase [Candidatus Absconditabacterales bacterium]